MAALAALADGRPGSTPSAGNWRTDPAWHAGKAEWALYDATRVIYGAPRSYEATIFTNKQSMALDTTTKIDGSSDRSIEVFKHNVSEIVPTENYDYRFLTTSFVKSADMSVYKVAASTQEDCGSSYRQIVNDRGRLSMTEFCYFPGAGETSNSMRTPDRFSVHDALTLTLRDYPFGTQFLTALTLDLVPDLSNPRSVNMTPSKATISEIGDETITVPYGTLRAHHLRVDHEIDGRTVATDYWFSAEPGMRNVLVQYEDAIGTVYRLKRFDWWAYWSDPRPSE